MITSKKWNRPLIDVKPTIIPSFLCVLIFLICWTTTVEGAKRRPRTQAPYVINNKRFFPIPSAKGFNQTGLASWYGKDFHGRKTSNGEVYNMYAMTAAHKTLPMNTVLLVKNIDNGKETVVRINDRGPFIRGRIIDLSYTAGKKLDLIGRGTAKVRITALAEGHLNKKHQAQFSSYPNFASGEFYVQIGAFTKKINALKLQRRFTDAGHSMALQKYYVPRTTLFRVQVYAGKTLDSARRAETALHKHGYDGAFIIAR